MALWALHFNNKAKNNREDKVSTLQKAEVKRHVFTVEKTETKNAKIIYMIL